MFPPKFEKKTLFEHALIEIVRFPERSFHLLPHCMLGFFVGWGKKVDFGLTHSKNALQGHFSPQIWKKTLFEHALIEIVRFPERSFHPLPHCMLGFFVGWGNKVDFGLTHSKNALWGDFSPQIWKNNYLWANLIEIVRFPERSFHPLPHCMLAFFVGWGKKVDMVSRWV